MVEVEPSRHHSGLRKSFGGRQGNCSRVPKSYHGYLGLCGDGVRHGDHPWRATVVLSALRSQGTVSPVVVYCQNNVDLYPRFLRGSLGWWV